MIYMRATKFWIMKGEKEREKGNKKKVHRSPCICLLLLYNQAALFFPFASHEGQGHTLSVVAPCNKIILFLIICISLFS